MGGKNGEKKDSEDSQDQETEHMEDEDQEALDTPGAPPKMKIIHKARLAALVESGVINSERRYQIEGYFIAGKLSEAQLVHYLETAELPDTIVSEESEAAKDAERRKAQKAEEEALTAEDAKRREAQEKIIEAKAARLDPLVSSKKIDAKQKEVIVGFLREGKLTDTQFETYVRCQDLPQDLKKLNRSRYRTAQEALKGAKEKTEKDEKARLAILDGTAPELKDPSAPLPKPLPSLPVPEPSLPVQTASASMTLTAPSVFGFGRGSVSVSLKTQTAPSKLVEKKDDKDEKPKTEGKRSTQKQSPKKSEKPAEKAIHKIEVEDEKKEALLKALEPQTLEQKFEVFKQQRTIFQGELEAEDDKVSDEVEAEEKESKKRELSKKFKIPQMEKKDFKFVQGLFNQKKVFSYDLENGAAQMRSTMDEWAARSAFWEFEFKTSLEDDIKEEKKASYAQRTLWSKEKCERLEKAKAFGNPLYNIWKEKFGFVWSPSNKWCILIGWFKLSDTLGLIPVELYNAPFRYDDVLEEQVRITQQDCSVLVERHIADFGGKLVHVKNKYDHA